MCSATSSTNGSATTSCASRWRQVSRPRCAASPTPACRSASSSGNRDFLLGQRFAEAAGATLLPEQIVVDIAGVPDAADARRRNVHRRTSRTSAFVRSRTTGAGRPAFSRCPMPCAAASGPGCGARAARRPPSSRMPSSTWNPAPSKRRFALRTSRGSSTVTRIVPRTIGWSSMAATASATCSPTGTTTPAISNSTRTVGGRGTPEYVVPRGTEAQGNLPPRQISQEQTATIWPPGCPPITPPQAPA